MCFNKSHDAFSLVELSIVLVILGLLTGGILAGQSLIRAAELRAMPTEVNRYNTAVMTFRDKYFALPGDFTKATDFWGTATTCPGSFSTPATDAKTCNGDGNGLIFTNGTNWSEVWRAWQHLANAGLVEGNYTGVAGLSTDTTYGVAGSNMPASKATSGAGYAYVYQGVASNHTHVYDGNYGNSLRWGAGNGVDQSYYLLASEAWTIDTKMDDGLPATGKVRVYKNTPRPNCASTDVTATAVYQVNLTTTATACNMIFIPGF